MSLEDRLGALEKCNKRLRACVYISVVFSVVLLVGQGCATTERRAGADTWPGNQGDGSLVARQISLVDSDGNLRGVMAVDSSGDASFVLMDRKGTPRCAMAAPAGDADAYVSVRSADSRGVMSLSASDSKTALSIQKDNKPRGAILATEGGDIMLRFADSGGRPRAELNVGPHGDARLSFSDADLAERLRLSSTADGKTQSLSIADREGISQMWLGASLESEARVALSLGVAPDKEGIVMSLGPGHPQIRIFDATKTVIWDTP